tara:strand:+ start:193 stop:690 length:498 start_codon:yes stop_codon:yes gene_type:complete
MKSNDKIRKFTLNLLVVLTIFIIDRLSKLFIIYLDAKSFSSDIFSSKFLNIYLIWNEGIAFGLFSFESDSLYNFLTIIILLVILIVLIMIIKIKGIKKYPLLMILGGALGNVYDRIAYNAVPDFIDFHVANFHWFIFNVADIFITAGVIFMIILEFVETNKKKEI